MEFKRFFVLSTLILFSDAFWWPNPIFKVDILALNGGESQAPSICWSPMASHLALHWNPNILSYGNLEELRKCSVDDFRRFGLSREGANNLYRNIQEFDPLYKKRTFQDTIVFPKSKDYDFQEPERPEFLGPRPNFPANIMRDQAALTGGAVHRFQRHVNVSQVSTKKAEPVLQWLPSGFSFGKKSFSNAKRIQTKNNRLTTKDVSTTLAYSTEPSTTKVDNPKTLGKKLEKVEEVNYQTTQKTSQKLKFPTTQSSSETMDLSKTQGSSRKINLPSTQEKLKESDHLTTQKESGEIKYQTTQKEPKKLINSTTKGLKLDNPTTIGLIPSTEATSDEAVLKLFPSGFHFINSQKNNKNLQKGFAIQHFDHHE